MKLKITNIHMIGIGGSGMSGIAEVLLNLGYRVTGSDLSEGPVVDHLRKMGAQIATGHRRENVDSAQVVVKSTAINSANPEVLEARERGIPIIPRAEMLAELMRLKTGIAVAGTHGKTTTTSFLATIFKEAELDPTVIIGGRLNRYGSNALMGEGEFLIAEADESDGSFLCLFPIINLVTNVDADHLDFYKDLSEIKCAFTKFMNKIPFYGINVVCGDDPVIRELLPHVKRPVITYGLGEENELRCLVGECREGSSFTVMLRGREWGEVSLAHPGRHNILNALGAIGVAIEAGVQKEAILKGLKLFGGVGRRFEVKGERDDVLVVDDYGHHPTEIRATLDTARECYPERRLVVLFQPHRFSRTKALFGEFCQAFQGVDELILTEIYPASEAPIPGVSGMSLAQGIKQVSDIPVTFVTDFKEAEQVLPEVLRSGDLFLTLGAGSVWKIGETFLKGL